ncbi:P27 family phage terminase small subunit [Paludisphaera borealis]|uniref:Phage terminase small subunit P27 family n=1 Tax=Paludisphaera borealis TaxID=1387353 RepID=A0A1U7CNF9_9BACT|nr:P27 family phage terminase small subunit [Paludisphaera borealis]APW60472.1 hypothetical protein BSF38_01942 [Paludisphaera borealis]
MAKRGRRPDPPELRIAKQNAGKTYGPFATIREAGEPDKPETISSDPYASEIWDRLVAMLTDRKILSPADQGIMVAYCSAYSTVVRCRKLLQPKVDPKTGAIHDPFVVFNEITGATKANGLLGTLSGAERSLASFASSLGLTPVDRGRAAVIEDLEQRDELEDILAG